MITLHSPRSRRVGFAVALVGVAVSLFGIVSTVAAALPGGTPPTNGLSGLVLNPSSGDSGTTFSMRFDPDNQPCPGNNNAGYSWSTFITPVAQDAALLTFLPTGQPQATATGRTTAFRDTTGEFVRGEFPDLDNFNINPPALLSFDTTFATNPVVDPGSYFVGIACYNADGLANERYWATRITVTAEAGAGPYGFSWATDVGDIGGSSTTTTTTEVGGSTTTTSVAGGSTTTTVAGGTTTTTVAGATTTVAGGTSGATVSPSAPTPGGSYQVTFPDCSVGETITFSQAASTPASVTDVCEASSALSSGSIAGIRMPAQATTRTATGSFTAAPTAPGSYTVTMTGTVSAQRTASFVIVGASTPVTGGGSTSANTGGSPTSNSTGTIPSTGSSTASLIVWGVLLLVFGRMAILLGRKPKVLTGT